MPNNVKKRALIFGITGQDGSYLAELLLEKGYLVTGVVRRSSSFNRGRIDHLRDNPNLKLVYGDVTDLASVMLAFFKADPDEVYNLAAQSHVQVSFEIPIYTTEVDSIGVLNILETIRLYHPQVKFYQASTSELYPGDYETKINEETPMRPRSPYGVAKLYSFNLVRIYRESYGLFTCNGILFNHESPRRGETFLTRKVTLGIGAILRGEAKSLELGMLNTWRDWGYAKEYVEAMWLMLQQDKPEDFVIATGVPTQVEDFVKLAFKKRNLDWLDYVKGDDRLIRPNEVNFLCGDASKAKEVLGWKPKMKVGELLDLMLEHDAPTSK